MTQSGSRRPIGPAARAVACAAGPPAQPRLRRAGRRGARAGRRRPAAAGRPAAGRAGAGRGAADQPDHGHRRLRRAARDRAPGQPRAAPAAGRCCPAAPGGQHRPVDARWTTADMHRPRRAPRWPRPPQLLPAARAAAEDLPRYLGGAGYHPTGMHRAARGGRRRGTPRAACRPRPTRSWSPTAPSTRWTWCCGCRSAPAAACWSSRRPTRTRSPRWPADGPGSPPTAWPPTGGWDADLLLGSLRQTRPKLAYLIPDFQNPTGAPDAAPRARAGGGRRARGRHRPGRRRVLRGPAAGRHRAAAAGRRLRPALPGDHASAG